MRFFGFFAPKTVCLVRREDTNWACVFASKEAWLRFFDRVMWKDGGWVVVGWEKLTTGGERMTASNGERVLTYVVEVSEPITG